MKFKYLFILGLINNILFANTSKDEFSSLVKDIKESAQGVTVSPTTLPNTTPIESGNSQDNIKELNIENHPDVEVFDGIKSNKLKLKFLKTMNPQNVDINKLNMYNLKELTVMFLYLKVNSNDEIKNFNEKEFIELAMNNGIEINNMPEIYEKSPFGEILTYSNTSYSSLSKSYYWLFNTNGVFLMRNKICLMDGLILFFPYVGIPTEEYSIREVLTTIRKRLE